MTSKKYRVIRIWDVELDDSTSSTEWAEILDLEDKDMDDEQVALCIVDESCVGNLNELVELVTEGAYLVRR